MKWRVRRSSVSGRASVPGDKSIAHRALIVAGMANGDSRIEGLPSGADVAATAQCLAALGVSIAIQDGEARVSSSGQLHRPRKVLDACNSGTTMRLLAGLLAGQAFDSCLTGDASLSGRPMGRVTGPLRQMGATISAVDDRPPLKIEGGALHGITYRLPVDSAQVKSAVLLAGLYAEGETTVQERVPTRDHTERMLQAAGVTVVGNGGSVTVRGGSRPSPFTLTIPGDTSSAAFLLAAALMTGGEIELTSVGVNSTRMGFEETLKRMGARIHMRDLTEDMGEPRATLAAAGAASAPVEIGPDEVPALVDELPLLALVATQAEGTTVVTGAQELRIKETDRIATVVESLTSMGARIDERPDGFAVHGPTPLHGAHLRAYGDHRLAMMLAVAGLAAEGETVIDGAEAAAVSFPEFAETLRFLGARIDDR